MDRDISKDRDVEFKVRYRSFRSENSRCFTEEERMFTEPAFYKWWDSDASRSFMANGCICVMNIMRDWVGEDGVGMNVCVYSHWSHGDSIEEYRPKAPQTVEYFREALEALIAVYGEDDKMSEALQAILDNSSTHDMFSKILPEVPA